MIAGETRSHSSSSNLSRAEIVEVDELDATVRGRAALAARVSEAPRVRVAALMMLDGKVVTVRHRAGAAVYHLLPGGGVDYRETLEHALLREIREETGLEARSVAALHQRHHRPARVSTPRQHHLRRQVAGGTITDSPPEDRVEAVDLVDPADLESSTCGRRWRPTCSSICAAGEPMRQVPRLLVLGG